MIGLEVQVGSKQTDGRDRESPRRRVFARSLVAAIVVVAIGYAAPAAWGAEVTFGAPDLDAIHPNFVDCDDGDPTTGPDPCSIVSKSSGFGASDLFATPFGGSITSMTVRQPQTSEIPGGGVGAPVSQAISIQEVGGGRVP